jgi:hypothetical protein
MNSYLINKADSNINIAYKNLAQALRKFDGYANWYDDIIEYKIAKSNIKSALYYAKKATTLGYQFYNNDINKQSETNIYHTDSVFMKKLKSKYPKWRKKCLNKRNDFDHEINIELQKMAYREQFIRGYIHHHKLPETWKYTNMADSINYFKLKSLILAYGFPTRTKLDFKSYEALVLMLIHMRTLSCVTTIDNAEMLWLDSTIKANILIGNIHPTDYAFMIDRYFYFYNTRILKNGELQIYGEFNNSDTFIKINDIANIDSLRNSIYLIPLKYKAKFANLKLPNEYIYKE